MWTRGFSPMSLCVSVAKMLVLFATSACEGYALNSLVIIFVNVGRAP